MHNQLLYASLREISFYSYAMSCPSISCGADLEEKMVRVCPIRYARTQTTKATETT